MPEARLMALSAAIETLPTWFSVGAGGGAGFFLFKYLFDWIGGRVDRREAAVEASAERVSKAEERLIAHFQERLEQMNGRISTLEHDLDECRRRDAEREAEVARLRAMLQGWGDARQRAQEALSATVVELKGNGLREGDK